MSLNHLLNSPELDISVKSVKVGTYNASPYNEVQLNPPDALMYYNTPTGTAISSADFISIHTYRNGDFIIATGYIGWTFPPTTLAANQGPYIDILIRHPEVETAYSDFTTRKCASTFDIKGISEISFRLLDGIVNTVPSVVAGTDLNTTVRQRFNVGGFNEATTNNVLYTFNYSILCKTK
jgi:hypothetical protein